MLKFKVDETILTFPARQLCFKPEDCWPYLKGLGLAEPCVEQVENQDNSKHFRYFGCSIALASASFFWW